jgi:hypothetical protein
MTIGRVCSAQRRWLRSPSVHTPWRDPLFSASLSCASAVAWSPGCPALLGAAASQLHHQWTPSAGLFFPGLVSSPNLQCTYPSFPLISLSLCPSTAAFLGLYTFIFFSCFYTFTSVRSQEVSLYQKAKLWPNLCLMIKPVWETAINLFLTLTSQKTVNTISCYTH